MMKFTIVRLALFPNPWNRGRLSHQMGWPIAISPARGNGGSGMSNQWRQVCQEMEPGDFMLHGQV